MSKKFILGLGFVVTACTSGIAPILPIGLPCEKSSQCTADAVCYQGRCFEALQSCQLNGLIEDGEACDDGNEIDSDTCTTNCQLARCGDGILRQDRALGETGFEACDDGNEDDTDGCRNTCEQARCGDGVRRTDQPPESADHETCDDGNEDPLDECTLDCKTPRCGDGLKHQEEACDDGNEDDTDGCRNTCERAGCGDGVIRTDAALGSAEYEACDDGNNQDDDTCLSTCQVNRCGDGFLNPNVESCDDGNLVETDACTNDCVPARCGDGTKRLDRVEDEEGFEACDDGNQIDEDACTNDCQDAFCGDGIVRRDLESMANPDFENCEPNQDNFLDFCRADCRRGPRPRHLGVSTRARCLRSSVAGHEGEVWCWGVLATEGLGCDNDDQNVRRNRCLSHADCEAEYIPGDRCVAGFCEGGDVENHCWGGNGYGRGPLLFNPEGVEVDQLYVNLSSYLCFSFSEGVASCHSGNNTWSEGYIPIPAPEPLMDMTYNFYTRYMLSSAGLLYTWSEQQPQLHSLPGLSELRAFTSTNRADLHPGYAIDHNGRLFRWQPLGEAEELTEAFDQNHRQLLPLPSLTQIISGSWGYQVYAVTLDGEFALITPSAEPVSIRRTVLPEPIVSLAVSAGSQCALLTDGTVWCGGSNGELGCLGRPQAETYSQEFEPIPQLTNIVEIAGHAQGYPCAYCARNADDHVWCWGANYQETPIHPANIQMPFHTIDHLINFTPRPLAGLPTSE